MEEELEEAKASGDAAAVEEAGKASEQAEANEAGVEAQADADDKKQATADAAAAEVCESQMPAVISDSDSDAEIPGQTDGDAASEPCGKRQRVGESGTQRQIDLLKKRWKINQPAAMACFEAGAASVSPVVSALPDVATPPPARPSQIEELCEVALKVFRRNARAFCCDQVTHMC